MTDLRLMAVLAHPDDESLGLGGTLARYAAEGVRTFLVTATPGDRGRFFDNENRPSDEEVGRVRARELEQAAAVLGVHQVEQLGYGDGRLDQADPAEVTARIAAAIRRHRPHVLVTFGPDGAYGHPDHIAISQLTCAAAVLAASPATASPATAAGGGASERGAATVETAGRGAEPHQVSKLYFMGLPPRLWDIYQEAFRKLVSVVDGVERQATPWPEWMLTTRVDARAHWETVWRAVRCHETQLAIYSGLEDLTTEQHETMWGDQHFYRVFSLANGGRRRETDLFEGLR